MVNASRSMAKTLLHDLRMGVVGNHSERVEVAQIMEA